MRVNTSIFPNPGIAMIPKKVRSHNTNISVAKPRNGHGSACMIQTIRAKINMSYKEIALPKNTNNVISVSGNAGICKYPSTNSTTSNMSMSVIMHSL